MVADSVVATGSVEDEAGALVEDMEEAASKMVTLNDLYPLNLLDKIITKSQ